ncbi:MAG: sulfatase-like hydrolase/transferase, partial [Bacteroidales bacterium]|nr:sulfatase-like hydrolase/transferase [Bacteroidales bacterium]
MDEKKCVLLGTLAGSALVSVIGCTGEQESKPLNIIYIMCDDHSYQTISAYDGRYIQTPNIDRIAQMGARFTNSFVSNSLSGPSRACLLTGKHSYANGFINNETRFDPSQQTFPKLLQEAGYQTAVVGKWHLVSAPEGFDFWKILDGQGQYYNPDILSAADTVRYEGYATDVVTDIALEWLDGRDSEKPFCLLLHHKAPHRAWEPDVKDLDLFAETEFPLPDNLFDDYSGRQAAALAEMGVVGDLRMLEDLKIYRNGKSGLLKYYTGRFTDEQREK